jgi:hypothetical protein
MVKHPFGTNIKKYLSQVDATLDINNFDSSALLAANDVRVIISSEMYDAIIASKTETPAENSDEWAEALELLCYAMAPLTLYHHFPWLQMRISNNGITTFKSNDETTAFKYQTDEGKEALLNSYAAYLTQLIDYLETNNTIFTDWAESDQRTETQTLLVKTYQEFDKCYPCENNAAFFYRSREIQRDIQEDKLSVYMQGWTAETPETEKKKIKKALVFYTLARCLVEWDYLYLSAPIKRDINNEMSLKNGKEIDTAREKVSARFNNLADAILKKIDFANEKAKQLEEAPNEDVCIPKTSINQRDNHVLVL